MPLKRVCLGVAIRCGQEWWRALRAPFHVKGTNFPLNSDLRHRLRRRRFLSLMADAVRRDLRHDRKLGLAPRLLHAGYFRRNVRNANSAVIGSLKLSAVGYKARI